MFSSIVIFASFSILVYGKLPIQKTPIGSKQNFTACTNAYIFSFETNRNRIIIGEKSGEYEIVCKVDDGIPNSALNRSVVLDFDIYLLNKFDQTIKDKYYCIQYSVSFNSSNVEKMTDINSSARLTKNIYNNKNVVFFCRIDKRLASEAGMLTWKPGYPQNTHHYELELSHIYIFSLPYTQTTYRTNILEISTMTRKFIFTVHFIEIPKFYCDDATFIEFYSNENFIDIYFTEDSESICKRKENQCEENISNIPHLTIEENNDHISMDANSEKCQKYSDFEIRYSKNVNITTYQGNNLALICRRYQCNESLTDCPKNDTNSWPEDKKKTYHLKTSKSFIYIYYIPHITSESDQLSFSIGNSEVETSFFIKIKKNNTKELNIGTNLDKINSLVEKDSINLHCYATQQLKYNHICWYKDGKIIKTNDRIYMNQLQTELSLSNINSEDAGVYECKIYFLHFTSSFQNHLTVEEMPNNNYITYIVIGVFLILLLLVVGYIVWYIRTKNKKKVKYYLELAGLVNRYKTQSMKTLNNKVLIHDQIDSLNYDPKWEFYHKLELGEQLGAGEFGLVFRAEATGIGSVAVKTVRTTADATHLRALGSELKIMAHLGKHLNVINLLGACTKNIHKDGLMVIVEFCRYGNLRHILIKNRKKFVTLVNDVGEINTEEYGKYLLPINDSNEKLKPECSSNCNEEEKEECELVISTKDLLCWAFQVARGMDFLTSKKVLHGDLATRNILLADGNVVKISDFGLAKKMYKSDYYIKKSNNPLPLKWMAIESLRDLNFSFESDVWSFGIVIWELFTLGQTPYPGIRADKNFLTRLEEGYRMEQPKFCPNMVYEIMLNCWKDNPDMRPKFSDLEFQFGSVLEDCVKQNYIDLNNALSDNHNNKSKNSYVNLIELKKTYMNYPQS